MIEFLHGEISNATPANMVVECCGVGYFVNISLNTFSAFQGKSEGKVLIHQVIREDAHTLYGFSKEEERDAFRKLISVSGVGPNTARMILSSLTVSELTRSISSGDVATMKSIKGIGAKSAQRIIVDLKDKIGVGGSDVDISFGEGNTNRNEALFALVSLGFDKKRAEKAVDQILSEHPDWAVEGIIKEGLKRL